MSKYKIMLVQQSAVGVNGSPISPQNIVECLEQLDGYIVNNEALKAEVNSLTDECTTYRAGHVSLREENKALKAELEKVGGLLGKFQNLAHDERKRADKADATLLRTGCGGEVDNTGGWVDVCGEHYICHHCFKALNKEP